MIIRFELEKSQFDGVELYGKLILENKGIEIKVNVNVRKNSETKELYVCLPSKKGKDEKFYNEIFFDKETYTEINKVLNKKFN